MKLMKTIKRKGMTLVEILFTFAIITSVVTLSYAASLQGWRTSQTGNQRTQGQYIAQDAIERVKAYRDSPDFKWTGAGSFLSTISTYGGDNAFYVDECTTGAPGCNFTLVNVAASSDQMLTSSHGAVKKPNEEDKVSDSTDYYIYLVITQHYKKDAAIPNSPIPSFPSDVSLASTVQSVSIEAFVEWRDATGIVSIAKASTILTDSVTSQAGYVPAPTSLPTTTVLVATPTATPAPTPTPTPAQVWVEVCDQWVIVGVWCWTSHWELR